MLTDDQRLILSTTIILHGFELYERFNKRSGIWRALLVGRYLGDNLYEVVEQWVLAGAIAPYRAKSAGMRDWQRMYWFKLTDQQLQDFHNTVVSTS